MVNAGGIINISDELEGYNRERAIKRVEGIFDTMQTIFELAREQDISTVAAATEYANERIRKVSRIRLVRTTEQPTPSHAEL